MKTATDLAEDYAYQTFIHEDDQVMARVTFVAGYEAGFAAAECKKCKAETKQREAVSKAMESLMKLTPEQLQAKFDLLKDSHAELEGMYEATCENEDELETKLQAAEAKLKIAREALESISAEKCEGKFEDKLGMIARGGLISIIDTDTAIAREALRKIQESP